MGTYNSVAYTAWFCCIILIQVRVVSSATLPTNTSSTAPTQSSSSTQSDTNSTDSASSTKSTIASPPTTTTTTTTEAATTTTTAAEAATTTTTSTTQKMSASTSAANPTNSSTKMSTKVSSPSMTSTTVAPSTTTTTTTSVTSSSATTASSTTTGPPSDNDLKPIDIDISNVTSTSFKVTWSHNGSVNYLGLIYDVMARSVDNDSDVSNVTCNVSSGNLLSTCSELSPGYMYKVTITVTYNNSLSVNNSKQESTIPSIPGGLETSSNLTYPDVTLVWTSSQGRVDDYLVTIKNEAENGTEVYSGTTKDNILHVTDLDPVTNYYITIIANSHRKQSEVRTNTFFTLYSAPDEVTNVSVVTLNATSVKVSWEASDKNLNSSVYKVTTNNIVDNSPSDQSCSVQGRNVSECIVSGLEEYWVYSFNVSVLALNTTSSPTVTENVTTDEGVPGEISDANVDLFASEYNCDATKVKVNWKEPDLYNRNSKITKYVLQIVKGIQKKISYLVDNPDPYRAENRVFEEKISELNPQSDYHIKIYAVSSSNVHGPTYDFDFSTDVCAPPKWDSTVLQRITKIQSTSSSVTINVPNLFFKKTEQGRIDQKGFIVLPQGSGYYDNTNNINPDTIQDWRYSNSLQFRTEYKIQVIADITSGKFEIGKDQCNSRNCNGPLPERFTFRVAAYACTENNKDSLLCTVTQPVGPFATKAKPTVRNESPSAVVIVLAVLMVLLAAAVAVAFLWYKDYINPLSWFSKKNGDDDDDGPFTPLDKYVKNRPIKICNYVSELEEMHRDTNLILSNQYDDINKFGQMIADTSTTDAARHEDNTPKNRWVNILPFDHSRVKLQQIDEDEPTSDYINANFMPGFNNKREYIATQGPLPGTIDDFWRMVWEHGVMVIVMLTQCKEGNRVKCEKYWPDELREPKQYGDVVVNPISISQLDKYNITIFEISLHDEVRQVIHFHYLDFPDFSANVEFDHFINFVRTVRSHVPHDMKGPIVVHCSAGVGRTGTFIATDRLQLYLSSDKFSEEDTVDIYGIVKGLREKRVAMVQTESQYIMIHDCFEKMLEEKREALKVTDSADNLYENQAFEKTRPGSHPYPETLYENVSAQEQTEL